MKFTISWHQGTNNPLKWGTNGILESVRENIVQTLNPFWLGLDTHFSVH